MKTYNMIITACVLDKNGDLTWHKEEFVGTVRQAMILVDSLRGKATRAWAIADGEIFYAFAWY